MFCIPGQSKSLLLHILDFCNARSSVATTGGVNSNGENCCAQWVFQKVLRTGCQKDLTNQPSTVQSGQEWCAIYNNYDASIAWGFCVETTTFPPPGRIWAFYNLKLTNKKTKVV